MTYTGQIFPSPNAPGVITGVSAGAGLQGGGTEGDVSLSLGNTGVAAGAYTNASITVDAQGRITLASSGAAPAGTDLSYTANSRLLESSTGTDVTLPLFATNSSNAGLVPGSSTGGTTNFLIAEGTWAAPISTGTDLSYTASSRLLESSTGNDVTLPLFAINSTNAGLVPGSSTGDTSKFLRADGSWEVPPGTNVGGLPGGSTTQIQFNDGGTFGGDADLTWNKTTNLLTSKGDISLDDGGAFATTIQTVPPTSNRTISVPNASGTLALVSGASGQLIYNSSGEYAGLTTILVGANGNLRMGMGGLASTPPLHLTGSWFTGGSATSTKPHFLIEPVGVTSTAWNTNGTGLGVNAPLNFAGRLIETQVNGVARFSVDSSGRFFNSGNLPTYFSINPGAALSGTGDNANSFFALARYNSSHNFGPNLSFLRSRNGTIGSHTIVQNNDDIGDITFFGSNGTSFETAARIFCQVDGTPSSTSMPGRIIFYTSPSGSTTVVERLRITNSGLLTLGGTTSSFPAIKRNSAALNFRLADDSGDCDITAKAATFSGNVTVSAVNIVTDTATGTRIGTATNQKIGFFNKTPIVQPAAIPNLTVSATSGVLPTPNGSVTIADAAAPSNSELLEYCVELETKLESALGILRDLGLIAT